MDVKLNFYADPEIGFLTKSISKPNDRAMAMPTAWEILSIIERRYSHLIKDIATCKKT